MDADEAIQRWDDFLPKIKTKAESLIYDAKLGCPALLHANDLDTIAMSNAWTAIEANLKNLQQKVSDVWDDKVVEPLEDEEWEQDDIDKVWEKGRQLNLWIEEQTARTESDIFSEAAQKILLAAKEILSKDHLCSQCSAPLELDNQFFRSRHIPCPYCEKLNTFEPGSKVRSVENFCVNHLAKHAALDLWLEYSRLDTQLRSENFEKLGTMLKAERVLCDYYNLYLKERIKIVPDYEKNFARDLEGKMRMFYEELESSPYWHNKRITET